MNYNVTRNDDDARGHDLPLETKVRKAVIAAELTPENRQIFTASEGVLADPKGRPTRNINREVPGTITAPTVEGKAAVITRRIAL